MEGKSVLKVNVKWGRESLSADIDVKADLTAFKKELQRLTTVPIEKQKILFKGKILKDDMALADLGITEGAAIMLMGAAEGKALAEQTQKTVFVEDLTAQEKAKIFKEQTGEVLPSGLVNMGNTCYMNASLQCLRRINEFKESVQKFSNQDTAPDVKLTRSLKNLMTYLDNTDESVKPIEFFQNLTIIRPHFGEMQHGGGGFKQQDADECFQAIIDAVAPYLTYENLEGDKENLIDFLFRIDFKATIRNQENPDEPAETRTEYNRKLSCIIDNQKNPIDHLFDGIKAALDESVTKYSPSLSRDAEYIKSSRISRLPPYLVVQKIRFLWKKASDTTGSKATKAKILRNVSFPKILDLYPLCDSELQQKLDKGRAYEKKQLEEKAESDKGRFEKYKKDLELQGKMMPDDSRSLYKQFQETLMEEETKSHDELLYRTPGTGLETGNYQLVAVLTHKGRTSDSGHYVGWVHKKGDDWLKYDDDVVSVVKFEEISNLRGGGDWHMAYYCIYRKLEVS
mmetsp:Transcript_23936/g.27821  ORF Transcript_23936/g.27821 Transcript_23936/m.27821 type:complete len:512 (+) Transcript_23936:53-1588(+)